MLQLLLLALAVTACLGEEELKPSATAEPIRVHEHGYRSEHNLREDLHYRTREPSHFPIRENVHHRDEYRRLDNSRYHDDRRPHEDRHHNSHRLHDEHDDDIKGPAILRSLHTREHNHHGPDVILQNKIISDVYSPDYAEPTWVLDYRYLKTGGRDYTRGPGGQIIILPKGIRTNEPKEFKNYDELIEHLRLKNLAERNKPQYFMPLGEGEHHRVPHEGHRLPHEEHRLPHEGHRPHHEGHKRPHDEYREPHHEGEWWEHEK